MSNPGKYNFYKIFNYTPATGLFTPLYNLKVLGVTFPKNQPVPDSTNFGGVNLLNVIGRDIAGNWDSTTKILEIVGFYRP